MTKNAPPKKILKFLKNGEKKRPHPRPGTQDLAGERRPEQQSDKHEKQSATIERRNTSPVAFQRTL
jgi:hypothetical protein